MVFSSHSSMNESQMQAGFYECVVYKFRQVGSESVDHFSPRHGEKCQIFTSILYFMFAFKWN